MSEVEPECLECARQYEELLSDYRHLKKKIRKMRKSFAAIECALTHKCDRYAEFIIGECEAHRGKYGPDGCWKRHPESCFHPIKSKTSIK